MGSGMEKAKRRSEQDYRANTNVWGRFGFSKRSRLFKGETMEIQHRLLRSIRAGKVVLTLFMRLRWHGMGPAVPLFARHKEEHHEKADCVVRHACRRTLRPSGGCRRRKGQGRSGVRGLPRRQRGER